jgi:hypothetical protein
MSASARVPAPPPSQPRLAAWHAIAPLGLAAFAASPGLARAAEVTTVTMTPLAQIWAVSVYGLLAVCGAARISPWLALVIAVPPAVHLIQPLIVLHDPAMRAALHVSLGSAYAISCYVALGAYLAGTFFCLARAPARWWPPRIGGARPPR